MNDPRHKKTVEQICADTRRFYESKKKFRVYHGSTNSTRHAKFDRDAIVDVSSLNRVLSIDRNKKTALVQPNVPMDVLVQETKRVGLLPPVVMEFPGITVGGGFVGTAGESSSFKYGFFDQTILWAQVVLADGTLVTASKDENQDLFHGLAGSFGTLGVLTLVEIQLIDAKSSVLVTYHPVSSVEESIKRLQAETWRYDNDYVDGILYGKNSGAIITGRLTTVRPVAGVVQRFSRPWDPWFYLHAKEMVKGGESTTDIVPIEDYLFRYDRGAFWTAAYAFEYFKTPFNWLTRLILNYFMHTRIMYHALHASRFSDHYIIQDLAIPAENTKQFIDYIDSDFGFYPLWICPLSPNSPGSMAHPHIATKKASGDKQQDTEQYINVGVWGPCPSSSYPEFVKANRDIEAKVRKLGGLKWLYARAFYTEEEFWEIYDEKKYNSLREKYKATWLPTVFEKVRENPAGRKEEKSDGVRGWLRALLFRTRFTSGLYGVYKATLGGDYMLARK